MTLPENQITTTIPPLSEVKFDPQSIHPDHPYIHVLMAYISCVVAMPVNSAKHNPIEEAIQLGYKEIYVIASDGKYKIHLLSGENRYIRLKTDVIPGYTQPLLKETLCFLPNGKVPHTLLLQIETFFRQVMEVHKSDLEAMAWILWSKEQEEKDILEGKDTRGYFIHIPNQTVSKASVSYDWAEIPAGAIVVVDIHSHNTMTAFFSGTDDADDRIGIRYSGVFGELQKPVAATKWRFNYLSKRIDATPGEIFDLPKAPIPEDWIDRIKRPSVPAYTAGYMGQVYPGYPGGFPGYPGRNTDHLGRSKVTPLLQDDKKGGSSKKGNAVTPLGTTDEMSDGITETLDGLALQQLNDLFSGNSFEVSTGNSLVDNYKEHITEGGGVIFVPSNYEHEQIVTGEDLGNGVDAVEEEKGTGTMFDRYDQKITQAVMLELRDCRNKEEFSLIAAQHGVSNALIYFLVQSLVAELDGEDKLLEKVAVDATWMIPAEKRKEVFNTVVQSLPKHVLHDIQTNGLNA